MRMERNQKLGAEWCGSRGNETGIKPGRKRWECSGKTKECTP